jgi:hypothetical protein
LVSVSNLRIAWPRLPICRRLRVASAAVAALRRKAATAAAAVATSVTAARWPVWGLRVLGGPLACLAVDVDVAVLAWVPFRFPRPGQRRALRWRRLRLVKHLG